MLDTGHSAAFPTTHWSRVVAAGDRDAPGARSALEELCKAYWFPVYALIRGWGHTPDRASELTQDYFTRLLEKPVIAAADRTKGRFRSFLKADCRHFLLDVGRKERVRAMVLGAVSIDAEGADKRYGLEPADHLTPDRIFDRKSAETLLYRVLDRLRQEYVAKRRGEVFDRLKVVLTQTRGDTPSAELAAQLGTTAGAVHTAVHRLKTRYRALLQQEIAATLDDPSEVDEEIRWLFEAVRR